jgi:hypothetical protein
VSHFFLTVYFWEACACVCASLYGFIGHVFMEVCVFVVCLYICSFISIYITVYSTRLISTAGEIILLKDRLTAMQDNVFM